MQNFEHSLSNIPVKYKYIFIATIERYRSNVKVVLTTKKHIFLSLLESFSASRMVWCKKIMILTIMNMF